MSVKLALLALLGQGTQGVYALRNRFEEVTGGTWPLNIGQAYSTVQRLERDGLVRQVGTQPSAEAGRPDIDLYALTEMGLAEVTKWWQTPVDRSQPARDEFTIKLALAQATSPKLAGEVIDLQRFNLLASLQLVNRQQRESNGKKGQEVARLMTIERQQFLLEAELRWLEHVQEKILRDSKGKASATTAKELP